MHPKLYMAVARQTNGASTGGIVITEKSVRNILLNVARSLFQTDISWAKIVSFYAVAGGLATDCVRQNHLEFISHIVETFGEVVEEELAMWISENGGWVSEGICNKLDSTLDFLFNDSKDWRNSRRAETIRL